MSRLCCLVEFERPWFSQPCCRMHNRGVDTEISSAGNLIWAKTPPAVSLYPQGFTVFAALVAWGTKRARFLEREQHNYFITYEYVKKKKRKCWRTCKMFCHETNCFHKWSSVLVNITQPSYKVCKLCHYTVRVYAFQAHKGSHGSAEWKWIACKCSGRSRLLCLRKQQSISRKVTLKVTETMKPFKLLAIVHLYVYVFFLSRLRLSLFSPQVGWLMQTADRSSRS